MEQVKEYLLENEKELLNVIEQINSLNGDLSNLDFKPLDEMTINEYFASPYEFGLSVAYGDFNFNDDVFRFGGDGNVESFKDYEAIEECKYYIDDVVGTLAHCYNEIELSDELKDLIEAPEKEEKYSSLDDLIKGATEKSNEQPAKETKSLDMER